MSNMDVGPGAVFGEDFQVVRPLRVGGMGAVYVAEQRSTGTLRALKVMQRELVSLPSFRERFEQEACIAAQIESDHVVQVIAAGVQKELGLPWLAMELLKGVPLDDYLLSRGPLSPGETCFIFEQLCHALGAAHERGIIHRDLKPANIFLAVRRAVGVSYTVKVLDFGIAKVLAEARTAKTAAVGTPLYMAPEQYEAGTVTPATDVWALGLIAFELLTGRSYWKTAKDNNATPASVMFETCLGELSAPSSRTAELGVDTALPDGFDAWFARCVQRNPALRFHDAADAFSSLSAVLGKAEPSRDPLPVPADPARPPKTASMPNVATEVPVVREGVAATESMDSQRPGTRPMTTHIVPQQRQEPARPQRARAIVAKPVTPEPVRSRLGIYAAIGLVGALGVGTFMMCGRPSSKSASSTDSSNTGARTLTSTSASGGLSASDPTHFSSGTTIGVEGRLLHENLVAGVRTETYVMLDLHGMDVAPKVVMPVHLSLVIDRSGSMKGGRLESAVKAATLAIERLRDGDTISVVTFDQTAQTLVAPTKLDATSRPVVLATIKKLGLGGNTCMSCGLSEALAKLGTSGDVARRILLLSDGQANTGVKDVAGFERIGQAAGKLDINITTIGVGDDYDSKSLFAIAHESNGQHYYASSDAVLTTVFDGEAKAFASIVATNAEATIRLPAGVQLVSVLDRSNSVETSGAETIVRVPLGQFTRNERKTVLVKVAIDPGSAKLAPVSSVQLAFREVGASTVFAKSMGMLAAPVGDAVPKLDPVVEARVQRSETAKALLEANELLNAGKTVEANNVLATQSKALAAQKQKWKSAPDTPTDPMLAQDMDKQQASVDETKAKYEEAEKQSQTTGVKPNAAPVAKAANNKAAEDAYKAGY